MVLDTDARIVFVNEKANNIIYRLYHAHYRAGRSAFDFIPRESWARLEEVFQKCLAGERVNYDVEVVSRNGNCWINCSYAPMEEAGIIVGISLVIEDITTRKELEREERKRKEAEAKLIQTRETFEHFMEQAPLRAWITDSSGRVHYMNHQYRTAFGFTSRHLGQTVFELFSEWGQEFFSEIQKVLQRNEPCEVTGPGLKHNGETGLFRITRFPLPVGGEVMVAGWAVEITEQVDLQRKLVQEEKNKKRQIVRSIIETQEKERREMSVELHDNVNQILSSCQLMLEVAKDNPETSAYLTEKTYHSLRTAISEIRRISHELNPSAIEDIGLTEAIGEMVEKINMSGKIQVQFHHKEYGSTQIGMADKIAVYRIVQEQLNNILKHAEASTVRIHLYFKPSRIYLHIQDNGKGFDMKNTKKGIGLKNIRHRVEYYQGKLKIETGPGMGCKLKVLLIIPS